MAKQKKKIAEPWISELQIQTSIYPYLNVLKTNNDIVKINLINNQTGEIRQKRVSVDQIVRRVFESELSTWKDIELEDIE